MCIHSAFFFNLTAFFKLFWLSFLVVCFTFCFYNIVLETDSGGKERERERQRVRDREREGGERERIRYCMGRNLGGSVQMKEYHQNI